MRRSVRIYFAAIIFCLGLVSCGSQDPTPSEMIDHDSQEQEIIFFADRNEIAQGECTLLRWEVMGGFEVHINDEVLPMAGEMEICPTETQGICTGCGYGNTRGGTYG